MTQRSAWPQRPPQSQRAEIDALVPAMTGWRHHFHAHPEVAFAEHATADFVAALLEEFGYAVHTGLAETGVVGTLQVGDGPGRIGLRADMDALHLMETSGVPHASRHPGMMHACGHDGHMAMLLGAARHLATTRRFSGTLHVIFQPAEEGRGGGRRMVEEGLFRQFPCDQVFGLHNWPEAPQGTITVHTGPVMAAADQFEITISGRGCHAAMPHHGIDPVVVAAQIITACQTLISRNTDPLDSAVLSITTVTSGTAFNIIPAQARLTGTVRSFRPAVRAALEQRLRALVTGIATAFGAEAECVWRPGYPATINHPHAAALARQVAVAVVGEEQVRDDSPPSMGAEDFAYMLEACPGAYVWLGQGREGGAMVHSPHYDFCDAILPVGVHYWATLVETALPAMCAASPAGAPGSPTGA